MIYAVLFVISQEKQEILVSSVLCFLFLSHGVSFGYICTLVSSVKNGYLLWSRTVLVPLLVCSLAFVSCFVMPENVGLPRAVYSYRWCCCYCNISCTHLVSLQDSYIWFKGLSTKSKTYKFQWPRLSQLKLCVCCKQEGVLNLYQNSRICLHIYN